MFLYSVGAQMISQNDSWTSEYDKWRSADVDGDKKWQENAVQHSISTVGLMKMCER